MNYVLAIFTKDELKGDNLKEILSPFNEKFNYYKIKNNRPIKISNLPKNVSTPNVLLVDNKWLERKLKNKNISFSLNGWKIVFEFYLEKYNDYYITFLDCYI